MSAHTSYCGSLTHCGVVQCGHTALIWAAGHGLVDSVRVLLSAGANVEAVTIVIY